MKQWYTAEQLAGLPGMPDTAEEVRRIADEMQWKRRPLPHKKAACSTHGTGRQSHPKAQK